MKQLLLPFILGLFVQLSGYAQTSIPNNYKLIYSQDFESPQAIQNLEMTDNAAWRITDGNAGKALELYGKSAYESRVRSPFNIAVIKNLLVGDFIMEVELSQTGREYGHRDLCLFFGIQNATNFYYVHIASVADQNANNIFIVNDEPRKNIASKTTDGTNWGETNSWHKARIERNTVTGSIKVYFDDMTKPIMEANDLHFDIGRIGVGSFDDTGKFDNIKIWAPASYKGKSGLF
jgi:hypothetical protein